MIEECSSSVKLAEHNIAYHGLEEKVDLRGGRVEDQLGTLLELVKEKRNVGMIDPPRRGLSEEVCEMLTGLAKKPGRPGMDSLLYLSCSPQSLVRDLKVLTREAWEIEKVIPFDFFPKTQHLETLVLLQPYGYR